MASTPDLINQQDIAANRAGFITEEQQAEAKRLRLSGLESGALFISGLCLVAFLVCYFVGQPTPPRWALPAARVFAAIGLWLAAAVVFGLFLRHRLIALDLAESKVLSAAGWVIWNNGPTAVVPGRPRWTSNRLNGYLLGAYRFYFLPRSGYLLSAELQPDWLAAEEVSLEAESEGAEDSPSAEPVDLPTALGFTAEDLEYNREQDFSPAQLARMQRAFRQKTKNWLGQIVVFGSLAVWTYFRSDNLRCLAILIGMGVLFLAFINLNNARYEMAHGQVAVHEGDVLREEPVVVPDRPKPDLFDCNFSTLSFDLPIAAYDLLQDGDYYRVYYSQRTMRFLSLERIPEPEFEPDADALLALKLEPPPNS